MEPHYRTDLSTIHAAGFGAYADNCAPGVLSLIESDRVQEIGCGAGALTKHLVNAGHEVLATDASSAMLDIAREAVDGARFAELSLGDDPIPPSPSIVSVGHVVNYLESTDEIEQGAIAMCDALTPGGLLVFDICDLSYGPAREGVRHNSVTGEGWRMDVTTFFEPPDRFVRGMTTFIDQPDGSTRSDHETHINVLIDVAGLVNLLREIGFDATMSPALGDFTLPAGMYAVVVRA